MSDVAYPPDDLVMVVDKHNTAHVLLPKEERPVFRPTLCGSEMYDLGALYDQLDWLAVPWSLHADRTYRAWPPWPCQTCVGRAAAASAATSLTTDTADA